MLIPLTASPSSYGIRRATADLAVDNAYLLPFLGGFGFGRLAGDVNSTTSRMGCYEVTENPSVVLEPAGKNVWLGAWEFGPQTSAVSRQPLPLSYAPESFRG